MTIDRRGLMIGAGASLAAMAVPAAAEQAPSRIPYLNPLDEDLRAEFVRLERLARNMARMLDVAQAEPVRAGALFDMRNVLTDAQRTVEIIGYIAEEQAQEHRTAAHRRRAGA